MLTKILSLQEFFVWSLAFSITFSNAAVETSIGLIGLFFLIRLLFLKNSKFIHSKLHVFIYILAAITVVSFFRSAYPKDSFKGILRILKYSLLYFSLLDFFTQDKKRIFRFFWVLIAIAVFTFLNGVFQGLMGFSLLNFKELIKNDSLRRMSSSFVHPNDFGAYIITIIPLAFAFLCKELDKLKRWVLFFACLLGIFCLFMTASRSAWIGFIVAAYIYFLYYNKKIALAIPLVIFVFILFLPHGFHRVKEIFDLHSGTSWERVKLWQGAWNMIKAHPMLGLGINTFSRYFSQFKPSDYPDLKYAHNSYLQMWSEIGIAGLGIFLCLIATVLKSAFTKIKSIQIDGSLRNFMLLGLNSGYIAFLIQAGLDTNLYSLVLVTHFWVLTSLIMFLCLAEKKDNL